MNHFISPVEASCKISVAKPILVRCKVILIRSSPIRSCCRIPDCSTRRNTDCRDSMSPTPTSRWTPERRGRNRRGTPIPRSDEKFTLTRINILCGRYSDIFKQIRRIKFNLSVKKENFVWHYKVQNSHLFASFTANNVKVPFLNWQILQKTIT